MIEYSHNFIAVSFTSDWAHCELIWWLFSYLLDYFIKEFPESQGYEQICYVMFLEVTTSMKVKILESL